MPQRVLSEDRETSARARELRRNATQAETVMWDLLRHRRLRGLKFRRQFPIAMFVADFCCYSQRLIIELDGGVHEETAQVAHDENRGEYLTTRGYKTLRISNHRLFQDPDGVLEEICQVAQERGWQPLGR